MRESSGNGVYKASRLSTPSLSISNRPDAQTNAAVAEVPVDFGHAPFTADQLQTQWQAFAALRNSPTELVIMGKGLAVQEDTILVKLDNQMQQSQLSDFKFELLEFLRKNLKNSHIQLQAEVVVQDRKRMVYTNREKFEYLAEKHPVLHELKNELGLDMDI